jgi:hypothetical protein
VRLCVLREKRAYHFIVQGLDLTEEICFLRERVCVRVLSAPKSRRVCSP